MYLNQTNEKTILSGDNKDLKVYNVSLMGVNAENEFITVKVRNNLVDDEIA